VPPAVPELGTLGLAGFPEPEFSLIVDVADETRRNEFLCCDVPVPKLWAWAGVFAPLLSLLSFAIPAGGRP